MNDLFTTTFGQLVQLIGMSGIGLPWSFLLLPAFILGDIIYRSTPEEELLEDVLLLPEEDLLLFDEALFSAVPEGL